jgi:hypothetical protein
VLPTEPPREPAEHDLEPPSAPSAPAGVPPPAASQHDAGDEPDPAVRFEDVATEPRGLPPRSPIEVVIGELLGAVPEVREHLLSAADELLDAARALLVAADRVIRQEREGSS